jgi:hypothetical protein
VLHNSAQQLAGGSSRTGQHASEQRWRATAHRDIDGDGSARCPDLCYARAMTEITTSSDRYNANMSEIASMLITVITAIDTASSLRGNTVTDSTL